MAKNILVTGATGKQGRAVVTNLLSSPKLPDINIIALTRNVDSPSAISLAAKSPSIHLLKGNLDDCHAVFASALEVTKGAPIWGVYSVQTAALQGGATKESEERQGKALVDIAVSQGVKHFVYSSVDRGGEKSGDNPTDVPHFRTKHNNEKYLLEKTAGGQMSYTIIRPVAFMEGFQPGFMSKIFGTCLKVGLRPEKPLQYVSVADIGWFVTQALLNPEDSLYKNQAISLAGDELTFDETSKVFLEKTGYPLSTTFEFLGRFMMWMLTEINVMFRWFDEEGYGADIAALRKIHPGLQSLGDYIDNHNGYVKK